MPLGITWYTLEEATAKYCLGTALILKWVGEGVVRSEQESKKKELIAIHFSGDRSCLTLRGKGRMAFVLHSFASG